MAGGGGNRGYVSIDRTQEQVERRIKRAEQQAFKAGFDTNLSSFLAALLYQYNERDSDLIQKRLDIIRSFIADELDEAVDSLFGGSVAKHTYVDGISDVDSLFIMKAEAVGAIEPSDVVSYIADLASTRLGNSAEVSAGDLAITVRYPEEAMEIQILPAVRDKDGEVKISSADGESWSKITPRRFQQALTKRNQECSGKLIPVIKLAKAILANLPEAQRMTGYHIESLAVSAFRNYTGSTTTHEMLVAFFGQAKQLVRAPIKDSTGQSINVDGYLGEENSNARVRRSFVLERIEKRMRNANSASSLVVWESIFGLDT